MRKARDLLLAIPMSFLAGATDSYGLARLHDTFVSFMSGNTTLLGIALGRGDIARSTTLLAVIGCFVVGAAIGAAIGTLSGRRHAAVVTCCIAGGFVVPIVWPPATATTFALAMGALNAAMNKVGDVAVSLTYVTGTLVKFGQGLGRSITGRVDGWDWLLQVPMWTSLLCGAATAAWLMQILGPAVWPLTAFAFAVAFATILLEG